MAVKTAVLWVMLPCSLLYEPHLRFKITRRPHSNEWSWLRTNGTVIMSYGRFLNDRKFTVNVIGCTKIL